MDRSGRHTDRYLQASKESLSNMSHHVHISGEKLTSSTRDLVQISTEIFSPQSVVNLTLQRETSNEESEDIDSRFSWLIMVCCGVLQVVSLSPNTYSGIVLVELVEVYPENRLTVIWLTSILNAAIFFAGPLAAVIIDKGSARICSALGSIGAGICLFVVAFTTTFELFCIAYPLAGVFSCMMYIPAFTHCVKFFRKYRVLVLLATTCFTPMSFIVLPPAVTAIVKAFGWREAILFAAALNIQATVFSMLLREPAPPRIRFQDRIAMFDSTISSNKHKSNMAGESDSKLCALNDGRSNHLTSTDGSLPKSISNDMDKLFYEKKDPNSEFVLENVDSESLLISSSLTHKNSELSERLSDCIDQSNHELQRQTVLHWRVFSTVFAAFLWGWGSAAYFVLLPIYSKDLGYSPEDTSILYIAAGIGSIVSRLLFGGIGQCIELNKSVITLLAMFLMALALFLFSVVKSLIAFSMGVAMYYIAYGLVAGFGTAVILEMHGEYKVEMVFGLQVFLYGFGLLAAPPFAENFNCSCIGLYVGCGVTAVGGLLYLPHIVLHYYKRRSAATTTTRKE